VGGGSVNNPASNGVAYWDAHNTSKQACEGQEEEEEVVVVVVVGCFSPKTRPLLTNTLMEWLGGGPPPPQDLSIGVLS
jgi:hypothetical protein